jgi:hypothetical protein
MKKQFTNKWELLLNDPSTPEELKSEARAKLGLQAEPAAGFEYKARLDSVVESFWGKRPPDDPEAAPRNAQAEAAYLILVRWLLLGGVSDLAESDAAKLLEILGTCRSHWMRYRVARSLLTIRVLHNEAITFETRHSIESALNALGFDYTQAEEQDWLELLRIAKQHETETSNTQNIER